MVCLFKSSKNLLRFIGLLSVLSFHIPCKSLGHKEKASHIEAYISSKNTKLNKNHSHRSPENSSPIIDKNYFEMLADSSYLKGEEAFFEGDNTKALEQFKKALLFAPSSLYLQKRVAEIYESEGLFAEALKHYKFLARATTQNKEFIQKISSIYMINGLNNKALKNHQLLLRKEPDNFSLHLEQALLLLKQQAWSETLKALKTAKTKAVRSEEKVQVILSQSYVFANLQDFAKSLKTMDKLTHFTINREDLILKIADFYKSLGQNSLALDYLENFQIRQGLTRSVSKSLLDLYIVSANWKKALRQMEQAQASGFFEDQNHFYTALLLMEKQNYDRALVFLKDLVNKNPKQGQYLYFLALAYERKKEWQKALSFYSQVPMSSPMFLTAKLQSSQTLRHIGRKQESFALLKKLAFPKKGISPQALLLYAESLWNSGYKKKALHALTKGLVYKPFHTDLLFLRGFYLKESGQVELALKDMSQILKKKEDHEEALNFVASLYSEQKSKLNQAEKMAHKALGLRPDSSYFLSTLGWILFQKGDLKSALHYLNKAFSKNKKDSHIAKRLGKVHLKLKNFKESEYFFKKALKLEKNESQLKPTKTTFLYKQAFVH